MAKQQKHKQPALNPEGADSLEWIQPKTTASAVRQALGAGQVPRLPTTAAIRKNSEGTTWEALGDVANAIGAEIGNMAQSVQESVQLINTYGCEHPKEFKVAVERTNADFDKFVADFMLIKEQHTGRHGPICTPDEIALSLEIFEKYNQFRAFFGGVLHHTQITFTEFAMEAMAIAKKKQAEEEAAKAAEQSSETQPA